MKKQDANQLLKLILDAQEFADQNGFVMTSEAITQASKVVSWDVQMHALYDELWDEIERLRAALTDREISERPLSSHQRAELAIAASKDPKAKW